MHISIRRIILTALSLFCLASCTSLNPVPSLENNLLPDMNAAQAKQERVLTALIDPNTVFDGAQAVIDAIESKYGIKTQVNIFYSSSILLTRMATGDMTDLLLFNTGTPKAALNPQNNMLELDDFAFADQLTDEFRRSASVDGSLYAAPFASSQAGAWLYNKQVYADLGLEIPHTWDALMANCASIQQAGIIPVLAGYKQGWSCQIVFLADEYNIKTSVPDFPQLFASNRAKYATTPSALRSFEKLADLGPYLHDEYRTTDIRQAVDLLVSGAGAHYPAQTSVLNSIYLSYPEQINNIGAFAQPGDDPEHHGLTLWMPHGWYVYRHSPNIDLAKIWLEFYVSQEGYDIYSAVAKPDGPYVVTGIEMPQQAYPGIIQLQEYFDSGKVDLALEFESPIKGGNCAQASFSLFAGETDPLSAAIQYDQQAEETAKWLKLPGW